MEIVLIVIGILAILLLFQRWFWILLFGLSGLASCFAMLASIIHFQILGAIGFFILMMILWGITSAIADR